MSKQTELFASDRGRIMAMNSAYDVLPDNRGRDIVVNASYIGVLPARYIGDVLPRGSISIDCAVGPEGAAIAGLWYLEALNVPAAAADVSGVILGDGVHLHENGTISHLNRPAADCGVQRGMPVREAARLMLSHDPSKPDPAQVTNRKVMETAANGRKIVCTDSIAYGLPEDVDNVLLTAGHTGRSAVEYLLKVRPFGFICSDGGMGLDGSGAAGMHTVASEGLAGAVVDARTARMGDALSTWHDGIISDANALARAIGIAPGMSAMAAARLLATREP